MIYVRVHSAKRAVPFVGNVPTIHMVTVVTVTTTAMALVVTVQ